MSFGQKPTFSRAVVTARKVWDCAALCGESILVGEDYLQDSFFDGVALSANLRYHFKCGLPNKKLARDMTIRYYNDLKQAELASAGKRKNKVLQEGGLIRGRT